MERTRIKFNEEYIKGIINGVMVVKSQILPAGYNLVVNNYDGMNNILLQPKDTEVATTIHLNIIQEIRSAIQRIFSEECDVKVKKGGIVFSIIERDEY